MKSEKHEKPLACKVNPAGRISEKVIKSEYNSDDKLKKQKEKVKVDKLEKESFQVATTLTENRIPSPGLRWDERSQDLMCQISHDEA